MVHIILRERTDQEHLEETYKTTYLDKKSLGWTKRFDGFL